MNIQDLYKLYLQHPVICTDTRDCRVDSMFFCLKGDSFDGNRFALNALELGARCAIVDDPTIIHDDVIFVDNVLDTLQELAKFHRNKLNIPFIGITGTNGKTTTKELVSSVLKSKYKVHATKGNLNNHIGVPLTVLGVSSDVEIAVIEMGANHVGEIADLCEIAQPTHGIITNIGRAHLEGFGGVDGVIVTKKALYDSVAQREGVLFVNSGDQLLVDLSKQSNVLYYGEDHGAVVGAVDVSEPNVSVNLLTSNLIVKTQLVGAFNLPNILAAIAIGLHFDVDLHLIQSSLADYIPQNNRSQLIKTSRNVVFMDAYNANPSSMEVALTDFICSSKQRKVAIVGAMKELGDYCVIEHQKIVDVLMKHSDIKAYFVGTEYASLHFEGKAVLFKDSSEALQYFEANPIEDSYVLLKGSRGVKLELILSAL